MKSNKNIIMFYTYSLLKFEFLKGKDLGQDEKILLDIMAFVKENSALALDRLNDDEIKNIARFREEETVLSETKTNYVDFIFAISLFSIYVGRNPNVFEERTEYKIIHVCNLFFETLKGISKDKPELLSKVENSVRLSYEFLDKNKLG